MILSEFNPDCGLCVAKMFRLSFQEKLVPYSKKPTPVPTETSQLHKKGLKGRDIVVVDFKTSKEQLYILPLDGGNPQRWSHSSIG